MKTQIRLWLLEIRAFLNNNRFEFFAVLTILIVGSVLRLYKIDQYMTFLGDEGRDVIIVRRIFTELHPPLIGPGTSIGSMYLGPFYYYLMAPALLIAGFSPIGPAMMIALLGVLTIWLVWYVFRKLFPVDSQSKNTVSHNINWGALIASGLYAISPTVIIYSRSSWNPNIMPFFALLAIFSVWKILKENKLKWLLVLGGSLAACLQSHYLALLLFPTAGIFWLVMLRRKIKNSNKNKDFREYVKYSIYSLVLFAAMMSPLLFFDMRHNWINSKALYKFFTVRQETVSIKPWKALPSMYPQFKLINSRLPGGQNNIAGQIVSVGLVTMFIWSVIAVFRERKNSWEYKNLTLLLTWFGFALVGFGLYKQHIYDHYFGFIFPVPFLLVGYALSKLIQRKIIGKVLAAGLFIYLIITNLTNSPLKLTPNNQLRRASNVAEKIKAESGGNRFNMGVIAERNYEDGYKYFLLKDGQEVVSIDSQDNNSITDQLFAVCELPKDKCDPTHAPGASIANFGWSKIENSWEIDGVMVYKLVHLK